MTALSAGLLLAGCAWLPAAGPTTSGMLDSAQDKDKSSYAVVPVDKTVIEKLLARPAASLQSLFGGNAPPPVTTISVGDAVDVSIWEAGGSTLFGEAVVSGVVGLPSQVGGARQAVLPEQLVMSDGEISVPFAGRIRVVGLTIQAVQEDIAKALQGKASKPQIIVNVSKSAFNSVTVNGEAVAGGRIQISPKGDRILDMIASVGGVKIPVSDSVVRLTRNNITADLPLSTLVENPAENIYVWPGDVLTVLRAPRSFEAFGAVGRNDEIVFGQQNINLSQALAKSGGLQDQRADPSGIFVLRYEPRGLAQTLSQSPLPNGDVVPVVYQFDFENPQMYFHAQRFAMHDKDIIYVSNAKTDGIQKFFQLLSTLTSPIVTGAVINNSVH